MYMYASASMCVFVSVCECLCVSVCVCVSVFVCAWVCIHVHACTGHAGIVGTISQEDSASKYTKRKERSTKRNSQNLHIFSHSTPHARVHDSSGLA